MIKLRWGFLFEGGNREVFGGWNSMTPNPIDSPKRVDLSGCEYAIIQCKDPTTYKTKTLASVHISEFIEFQTIALAPARKIIGMRGRTQLPAYFGGLRIVKRGGATEVYANGAIKHY